MLDRRDFTERIKCIAYDFDGVMTDNTVYVDQEGRESVRVNRSDGLAISRLKNMGYRQVIISTEKNPVVSARAHKLKIDVMQDISDKGEALKVYCSEHRILPREVLYIGNDVNDIPAMRIAGIRGAPIDACKEIIEMADWVSGVKGGRGVIRDLYYVVKGNER